MDKSWGINFPKNWSSLPIETGSPVICKETNTDNISWAPWTKVFGGCFETCLKLLAKLDRLSFEYSSYCDNAVILLSQRFA